MVNPLRKVYNKTPWEQKRLSKPLSDPNYIATPLQQSTIYEHNDQQGQHHEQDQRQQQQSSSPATPPLQRQVSIALPPNSNNSGNSNNNNSNNNGTSNSEPVRRGMTRADTKISLRKSKKDSRRVFVNIPPPPQYLDNNGLPKLSFGSNRINTAKYTALTFLPKNLFEQFRRVANMFFLFMAIIQLTPIFTVGSPFLTVFPLCFVVGVTAIKDGFEDYKRHVEDRNFNQRLCQQLKNVVNYNYPTANYMAAQKKKSLPVRAWAGLVRGISNTTTSTLRALKLSKKPPPQDNLPHLDLNQLADDDMGPYDLQQQKNGQPDAVSSTGPQPEFVKEQWHNLRVGDFIMLKNNQAVPADAIILSTSEAEGSCFIETKDLDGETNLKTRMSLHETSKYNTARRCSRLKFYVDMEPINANLFTFNGSLTMLAKKRRPANMPPGHSAGPSGNNRFSHYAPSITSSMMSSVRGSMDENDAYRETFDQGYGNSPVDGSVGPAQSGTSASDYARLHKSPSQRRRSRLSGSHSHSHGDPTSSTLPTAHNGDIYSAGDKQEYEELSEIYQDDQHPGAESSFRPSSSKRGSLHRTATAVSMAGASDMAKSVLRSNYEQQFQQQQQPDVASPRRRESSAVSNGAAFSPADSDAFKNNCPYKETTIPVDINNMLLRGHVIRNTHWVIAVIVATGTETKIMLNSGETPSKRSRIEKTMNIQVAINFGILLLLCVVCAVGSTIYDRKWRGTGAEQLWDRSARGVTIEGVITFFTSLIIFQNIIPISLYISIEFVKTFQAYFIWQDSDMYDIELDQFCTPKTWNLTDDLGQIEYVFSDKTGTLTRNIMEFKKCSINGKIYGNNAVAGQTDAEKGLALMGGQDPSQGRGGEAGGQQPQQQQQQQQQQQGDKQAVLQEYDQEVRKIFEPAYMDPLEILTFADPDIIRDLTGHGGENRSTTTAVSNNGEGSSTSPRQAGSGSNGPQHDGSPSSNIHDFFTLLALCHTVVVEQPEEELEDDEDDEFGLYAENGSPPANNDVDENGRFVEPLQEQQEQQKGLGIREKLKQKAEAHGLSVPGAETKSGTRSRKNSNAGSISASPLPGQEGKPQPTIKYRAESPDEAALVSAAKNVGFAFVSRGAAPSADGGDQKAVKGNSRQNVNLNILGQDHTYEQLDVIKFNSTRKRMTVIVREPQELGGKILLLTKGADNVIFERLAHTDDETLRDHTERDIEAFSNMGLRTLTLAQRVLDQETYDQWAAKYAEAGKALDDRAKKMDQVAEEIERDLTLLGATAIEDKLQEGVPDSIAALREAGIKVWVLTGDKLETAINIGFASRLLEKDMKLEIMKMGRNEDPTRVLARFKELVNGVLSGKSSRQEESASIFEKSIESGAPLNENAPLNEKTEYQEPQQTSPQAYNAAGGGNTWDEKHLPPTPAGTSLVEHEQAQQEQHSSGQGEHALIVDGSALKILLDDPEARQDLIKLSDVCFSVICCRASPLQKALVVELIRRGKKTVCLAIGDGANDVSMIQAANIGVGISGQEGMQAAMASDYSITQFRFVRKLVLVHGHWGYMRIAEMILNFFFKNVLWVAAVLWFQIYCGFSAMLFYDYTFVSLYNLMLTAVPVLVLGATDQDLTAPYVLRYPGVYKLGIQQRRYNQTRFIIYMLDGVWQSLVVFWFWRGVYGLNVLGTRGFDNSLLEFSTSVAITNVVIASLYVGLHSYHWTWLTHFAVWGSITFLVLLIVIYGFFQSSPIYHVAIHLFTYGPFWFMLILSVVTALLARFTILFVSFWWFPDDVHVVRRIMLSEKWNAKALKAAWTGLAPDGLTPAEQTEQEKALLKKQDCINAEKEAAKLAKKNAKDPNFNDNNNDQHPNTNQLSKNARSGANQDQPYDLTMIQINVDDHSQATSQRSAQSRSVPAPTPLQIQQQLLMAQQHQKDRLAAEAAANGSTDRLPLPNDPSFQHSRRTSSYNYNGLDLNTLKDKPAALPPIPSPSLPSLPSESSGSSSVASLHQSTIPRHGVPPRIVTTEEAVAAGAAAAAAAEASTGNQQGNA
ncbi:hypothetical protein BG015_009164 [Linnemannia schmuckeri]|uniref:P-type phospholipid transporter n=1 Tax=Linnemannia schmuckeri TaxID=64567 RepID=A0A9P5RWA4_9FUNG|nr:hypothetical protein BG015_009164 [Linnemannia schmuckeri]